MSAVIRPFPAVAAVGLPIVTGPVPTFDLGALGHHDVSAIVSIAADRIGFHVEPDRDGDDPAHYLTVAPAENSPADRVVLLALSIDVERTDRVLDVIQHAIADGLAGDIELHIYPAMLSPRWYVSRAVYTDAEGERYAS